MTEGWFVHPCLKQRCSAAVFDRLQEHRLEGDEYDAQIN